MREVRLFALSSLLLPLAVLALWSAPAAHGRPSVADTIYVDQDAGGADDGTSWANAYPTLQDALQEARANGTDDAVWVAEGVYYPDEGDGVQADDRTASFHVESGIDLHGRFEGNEEGLEDRVLDRGINETILSGEIQQDADSTNNAYTVLRLTGGAAGEIQVTGGQADGTGPQGEGGGAYITGGELHHAILTGNHALRGSAVYAENSPTLAVVRATGNHASETGTVYLDGGAATLRHVTIADNTAEGGASGVQFVDSDATVEDFAFGPDATNDVQSVDFVTATYNGNVDEEGQPLSGADVTIEHVEADSLIASTTSDDSGFYEATQTFPEDQGGFTSRIITDKGDHRADTTTVSVTGDNATYTNDFNLERLVHDLTITTTDSNTENPVDASGTISVGDQTLSYTTGGDGEALVEFTSDADDLSGDATNQNYNESTFTAGLGADEDITVDATLAPITHTRTGTATGPNGSLDDATVTLIDSPGDDSVTTTTGPNGEYTASVTVNDGFETGATGTIAARKQDYKRKTRSTEFAADNREQTEDFTLQETSTTDRIPITFTNETVADTLYSGDDYGSDFTTTVSTDDTTFTVEGTVTAQVPVKDGDTVDITHSDPEYINTFVANNTDTELPPHDVSGFPDEPDYQATDTISIAKSNVVNDYQVKGIPDTSPEGYSTIDDWKPHLDLQDARRFTELGGYDSLATFIQEGHPESWEDKADTVVPEVQGFMPIPINGPEYVTDEELGEIVDNRNSNNVTRIDLGDPGANFGFDGDYLKNSSGFFSDGSPYSIARSEIYSAFTGFDEINDHSVKEKILDQSDETFIPSEASFPINIQYNLKSNTSIE